MNQSFYTAAVGAQQQMIHLNIQGNNVANVNTQGYKAQKSRFVALFRRQIESVEQGLQPYGVGTRMLMTSTDHSQGAVASTGRVHDYMIKGDGYFAVVDMATNEVSFTRRGRFDVVEYIRPTGEEDEEGNPIMETIQTLADEEGRFALGKNGNIIVVKNPEIAQEPGIFDYNNYDGMYHASGTHFTPVEKNGALYFATGELMDGALEGSNVDFAYTMTKVIEAQRAYSMALKMVQTSDELETTINSLR